VTTLLIATRNAHKVQEIGQILGGDFRCLRMNEFPGAPAAVEDADTFAGNATKKVLSLAQWVVKHPEPAAKIFSADARLWVVADDSGLEVDALNGAPGVHSARFAAGDAPGTTNTPDAANNAKLLRLLAAIPMPKRTGRFRCALAVLPLNYSAQAERFQPWSPGQILIFEGACHGRISERASGQGGFGYDPLFVPDGYEQSFGELGETVKNGLSHRARALEQLREFISEREGRLPHPQSLPQREGGGD
jgi:XTP/dITP diphosphohydrolase